MWCLSSLWNSQTFRTPKRLMGINCQSALEWLLVWILLCQLDVFSVCLPLISSIKHHKSNYLFSVWNNIFYIPFFLWWAIRCLFPGMSDPCCSQVDKFCKREGQSQCGEFVLTSPSLGCHSTAALILREPGAVILLTGFFPAALSLQRSHQLTHSLQNALELLCEAGCVFRLSSLKRIALSHLPYLFSKIWLLYDYYIYNMLISCQCLLAHGLMGWCCAMQLLLTSGAEFKSTKKEQRKATNDV